MYLIKQRISAHLFMNFALYKYLIIIIINNNAMLYMLVRHVNLKGPVYFRCSMFNMSGPVELLFCLLDLSCCECNAM